MSDELEVPGFRFNLRRLFLVVTLLCVVCAVTAPVAADSVLIYLGVLAAAANYLGVISLLQRQQRRHWTKLCVFLMLVLSLLLPAVEVEILSGVTQFPGWGAAWFGTLVHFDLALRSSEPFLARLIVLPFAIATVLGHVGLLLYFAAQFRRDVFTLTVAHWFLIFGNAAAWCWVVAFPFSSSDPNALLVGYYVWCTALALAMSTMRIQIGKFVALVAASTTFAAMFIWLDAI